MANPPDSGEREVPLAEIRPCWHMTVRHRIGMPSELWCETCGKWRAVEKPSDDVTLSRPLAQRILAALEGLKAIPGEVQNDFRLRAAADLAPELRAAVERKP